MNRRALRMMLPLALLASSPAATPDPAAIAAQAQRYRFDLARNFFRTPEAEAAARAEVARSAVELTEQARAIDSGAELLRAIEAEDEIRRRFRRHDLYQFLRYATDIRKEEGLRAAAELRAEVVRARQALGAFVTSLQPARLAAFVREAPGLARYSFYIESLRRDAAHTLRPDQQVAVDALEPLVGGADYPQIVRALSFESIDVGGRRLDVRRDQNEIRAHPSAAIRDEGARRLFAGYARQRDILAFMLGRTVRASDAVARLRGFRDAREAAAYELAIAADAPEQVLAAVAAHAPAYRGWQQRVATPETMPARWLPDEAVRAVVASAAPLGPIYRREFAELLRAENGRVDFAGGENRLPITGTASVYPTGASAIYMGGYHGVLLDLLVLAHEGGHAVQAQLMHRAGVPMAYAAGPAYLTESFGRFQELLLFDTLRRTAPTAEQRRGFRDALAWRLYAVFPSAEEAAVELAIHRSVRAGGPATAEALDAATAEAGAPFSIEYERLPERRGLWMLSEGYYMAPLHEIADLYSSLLAVRYFSMYRQDPGRFRTGYFALLSGGYSAEASALLRRHLGIDPTAADFAEDTMAMLRDEVAELYRR